MPAGTPLFQVDAFTDTPFTGNPAAVCLLDAPRDEGWMQALAREMNLSETAFVLTGEEGFRIRWFTPVTEVDLCGHATLAAAHVLWESGRVAPGERLLFLSRSGPLRADRRDRLVELDFPAVPASPAAPPAGLLEALGVPAAEVFRSRFDLLVVLESESQLRGLDPDLSSLARVEARGVIVTAPASGRYHFVSRFFAPRVGVDEDPVTGSAHCVLAPWWGRRLGLRRMEAFQASARGGSLHLRWADGRVVLGGRAVTVFEGVLGV